MLFFRNPVSNALLLLSAFGAAFPTNSDAIESASSTEIGPVAHKIIVERSENFTTFHEPHLKVILSWHDNTCKDADKKKVEDAWWFARNTVNSALDGDARNIMKPEHRLRFVEYFGPSLVESKPWIKGHERTLPNVTANFARMINMHLADLGDDKKGERYFSIICRDRNDVALRALGTGDVLGGCAKGATAHTLVKGTSLGDRTLRNHDLEYNTIILCDRWFRLQSLTVRLKQMYCHSTQYPITSADSLYNTDAMALLHEALHTYYSQADESNPNAVGIGRRPDDDAPLEDVRARERNNERAYGPARAKWLVKNNEFHGPDAAASNIDNYVGFIISIYLQNGWVCGSRRNECSGPKAGWPLSGLAERSDTSIPGLTGDYEISVRPGSPLSDWDLYGQRGVCYNDDPWAAYNCKTACPSHLPSRCYLPEMQCRCGEPPASFDQARFSNTSTGADEKLADSYGSSDGWYDVLELTGNSTLR